MFSRMMMSAVTAASGFTPAGMSDLAFTMFPGTAHTALYQERTGVQATTPASVHNDPVGTVHDLITGRYAVAPSDAARPLLGIGGGLIWLDFSGLKRLSTSTPIDLTGTDKVFACACVTKMVDVTFGVIVEHGADTFTTNGAFALGQRNDGVNIGYGALLRGTARTGYWLNTYAAAHNAIVDASFDIAGASTATEVFPFVNDAAPTTAPLGNRQRRDGQLRHAHHAHRPALEQHQRRQLPALWPAGAQRIDGRHRSGRRDRLYVHAHRRGGAVKTLLPFPSGTATCCPSLAPGGLGFPQVVGPELAAACLTTRSTAPARVSTVLAGRWTTA